MTKDRAGRKKFARWANLAKETAFRGGKLQNENCKMKKVKLITYDIW